MSLISQEQYLAMLHPADRKTIGPRYADRYLWKYEIAERANQRRPVRRILEIGVRRGYSAHAFLSACPGADFIGIDWNKGKYGGTGKDERSELYGWMMRHAGTYPILRNLDSQALTVEEWTRWVELGDFDFAHVDADHSEAGCRHDMELAWATLAPGGTLLVDDYHFHKGVKRACAGFLADHAPEVEASHVSESYRGDLEIWKAA